MFLFRVPLEKMVNQVPLDFQVKGDHLDLEAQSVNPGQQGTRF